MLYNESLTDRLGRVRYPKSRFVGKPEMWPETALRRRHNRPLIRIIVFEFPEPLPELNHANFPELVGERAV